MLRFGEGGLCDRRLKIREALPIPGEMSFQDAIGRIDQILQLQQQILDPGAATSSSSPTSGTGSSSASSLTSGGSSAATTADFATALASAQAASDGSAASALDGSGGDASTALGSTLGQLLLDPSYPTTVSTSGATGANAIQSGLASIGTLNSSGLASGTATGDAVGTGVVDPRVQAMIQEANSLVGEPYVWGGGHSGWGPQTGYDCSGFVSAVLHAGGYLSSPQDTATLPDQPGIEQGPGQSVTIYDRDESGEEGHVIIDIAGQFYESGGESGSWGGGGGVERIATPSAAYLATFNDVLHPAGL